MEWRSSPMLPFAGAMGLMVSVTHIYSIGLFVGPLHEEFGWSRGDATLGLSVVSVICGLLGPFIGVLVDRWGSRRIGLPGLILYCLAFAALSLSSNSLWMWWALWGLLGLGALCVKATVWTTAVASCFNKARGIALAIALSGTGFAAAIIPLLSATIIAEVGWRLAYVTLAGLMATVSLPLVFLFLYDAAERQQKSLAVPRTLIRSSMPGMAIRDAMLSSQFLRLAIISLTVVSAMTAITLHIVPILIGRGLSITTAASAAGLVGMGSIMGRISAGYLLDRLNPIAVGSVLFSLPIVVALGLLQIDGSLVTAMMLTFVLGIAVGGEIDVIAFLTARYFGTRHFGTLMGTLGSLQTLAVGIGPVIAAYLYDRDGSYSVVLMLTIPVFLFAALLLGSLWRSPALTETSSHCPC